MEEDIKVLEEIIDDIIKYSDDEIIKLDIYKAGAMERILLKLREDEAVIEEMAEYLSIVRDCPNEDKGANLDCENRCSDDDNLYLECWKQYFRNKVKENKE